MRRIRLALVAGCPSWHHPRLYQMIASRPEIDLTVYFCSAGPLEAGRSSQMFGAAGLFGSELLEGYRCEVLPNYPLRGSRHGSVSLGSHCNIGVWPAIINGRFDVLLIEGWNDLTFWLAAAASGKTGLPYLVCGDATPLTDALRSPLRRALKKAFLGGWFFRRASGFLYRCELNRRFFLRYGVDEGRLFPYPFPVEAERYVSLGTRLAARRSALRHELGLREEAFIVLFVGRFSPEKQPLDLVAAFARARIPNKQLVMIGGGPLQGAVDEHAKSLGSENFRFPGFLPREEVLPYYAAADVLVLPSSSETHGDVVVEAACFGLPSIVSNCVGSAYDVVRHEYNGLIFPCGDVRELTRCLDALAKDQEARVKFGARSRRIVAAWGYEAAVDGLASALDATLGTTPDVAAV